VIACVVMFEHLALEMRQRVLQQHHPAVAATVGDAVEPVVAWLVSNRREYASCSDDRILMPISDG
jgi:hypothetical protein